MLTVYTSLGGGKEGPMRRSEGRRNRRSRRSDAFTRVRSCLERARRSGKLGAREARERLSDAVRLAGRLRRLEERLGQGGLPEMSPYLESLLRLAAEPAVVQPAVLRRAAGF